MSLGVSPDNCTVFIQLWVDINALVVGKISGCYGVDNLQGSGEGTPNLNSKVATNTSVCWQVLPIDPQYAGTLSITQISAPSGWQDQPAPYSKGQDIWTGTVSKSSTSGNIVQSLAVNYNYGAQSWSGELPLTVSFK
ncbi:hypothetical protein LPW26_01750 [Rhodopseudomonas sp. HC1]|uniref:hypothetical protein n=1 Tax=Rhodopseudomonas infernalis TaxID=2897386 RepID=UPI001EE8E4FF|nr:hypothetical protein [Rhodopseudomonas infernalis]MCG6203349.1 hypothetical protein [Rhodopseudomonas infernalis]